MTSSFKKSYKFALKSALLISILLTLLVSVFLYVNHTLNSVDVAIVLVASFLSAFLVVQYRVERYIYQNVKKIYDDLTLLESSTFRRQQITTDMATLTEEIDSMPRIRNSRSNPWRSGRNTGKSLSATFPMNSRHLFSRFRDIYQRCVMVLWMMINSDRNILNGPIKG